MITTVASRSVPVPMAAAEQGSVRFSRLPGRSPPEGQVEAPPHEDDGSLQQRTAIYGTADSVSSQATRASGATPISARLSPPRECPAQTPHGCQQSQLTSTGPLLTGGGVGQVLLSYLLGHGHYFHATLVPQA